MRPTITAEEQYVIDLINNNDDFVQQAVLELYNRQTCFEKRERTTSEKNRRGFSSVDAKILSDFARYAIEHGYLTPKQLAVCRRLDKSGTPLLGKYRVQLLESGICIPPPHSPQKEAALHQNRKEDVA